MLTRHGFTTVVDTGSLLANTSALRKRTESGEVAGPRILTTGPLVFPKGGGLPPDLVKAWGLIPGSGVEFDTVEEGRAFARRTLDEGADANKMYAATWATDPKIYLSREMAGVLVSEAHARGKLALAHPTDLRGIETSLDAGVDVLVHTTPEGDGWSEALVQRMTRAKVSVIPTLTLWRVEVERDGGPEAARRFQRSGVRQLAAFVRAKGDVLFGTDIGYISQDDPTEEFQQMAAAGMSARDILASLTMRPAERFGRSGRSGRLAVGMDADLVLLGGDPAASVGALSDVRVVVRSGRTIYGTLRAAAPAPVPNRR